MPLSWIFYLLLGISPFLTYGVMSVREKIVVQAAVRAERTRADAEFERKLASIEQAHNAAVRAAVDDARAAADEVGPLPESDEELREICRRSASCADRDKLK